jgi:hypothetical protein
MLEKIQTKLFEKYKKDDKKGLFVSVFDADKKLLLSNGVVNTDKSLEELSKTLYDWLVAKQTKAKTVVLDVVKEIKEERDIAKLSTYSLKEYGLCLIDANDNKSWILLPNTQWATNFALALKMIKEKNGLWGEVNIYVFTTERILVSI